MKIYTRTGDRGETGLPDGTRVSKDAAEVEALGTLDELNSVLGLARAEALPVEIGRLVEQFQNDLLAIGAEVAAADPETLTIRRIGPERITALEETIDQYQETLSPLEHFILPAGTRAAAALHHARAVCRRAERRLVALSRQAPAGLSPDLAAYLNRLGDLLFVLARAVNARAGHQEVPWRKQ
ncbi:MAG TPA: cob(I)yrinic acid a,c-diamide adenosyltransferase [Thermoguttaceae bacterium]|nr:cob(I)yrinic acid a,c-diamide adenosyltransferase [Thermoguttaceae bacterium]